MKIQWDAAGAGAAGETAPAFAGAPPGLRAGHGPRADGMAVVTEDGEQEQWKQ